MELRLANGHEQVERDQLTFAEWGSRLSVAQYLERERVLRAHPFSRGLRTWLLVEGRAVLASCETYDNLSFLGATAGVSQSVASVFTEPALRGKGYATTLLDLVVRRLAQEPDGQACVLFSDVGERQYARSGFQLSPAVDWVLPPRPGASLPWEPVPPALSPPPPGVLKLCPTEAQLDWAFERERLYARFLGTTAPRCHGARSGDARACWAAYFKDDELIVLWLEPGSSDDTAAVLAAAQAEAHHCGLGQVRLWAPTDVPPLSGVTVRGRTDELPMARLLSSTQAVQWRDVQRALWV